MAAARKAKVVMLPLTTAAIDPLLRSIFEALAACGGAAHRDQIIRQVVEARSGAWAKGVDALREEIIAAFENYLAFAATMASPHPFACKPFGPDSRRWALTVSGRAVFASSGTLI
jgi:hypothetical protein